jgi:micrococcal nuclease
VRIRLSSVSSVLLLLVVLVSPPCLTLAAEFIGPVVGVIDGDTITVLHNRISERIRLHGIDCPEKGQAFSKRAKRVTSDLAFGKTVTVQTYGKDKYERTIGDVILPDDRNLNQELLSEG